VAKKLFLPAKAIFATPVLFRGKKPGFFHRLANLPTLLYTFNLKERQLTKRN